MRAVMAEGLGAEGRFHHAHHFEQPRRRLREVLAEALELIGLVAAADAEHEPPMRQRIHHPDLRNEPGRVVERDDHHAGAEADARCLARQPRDHH